MSLLMNIDRRLLWAAILIVGLVGVSDHAIAETSVTDSPLFALNTLWASHAEDQINKPAADRLGGCYPNPFNPQTTINYELSQRTAVNLGVYDLQGRLVKALAVNEWLDAGVYEAEWDGRDTQGGTVAAGVYLYRLVTKNYVGSQRMTLLK